jgi:hypothetical protein
VRLRIPLATIQSLLLLAGGHLNLLRHVLQEQGFPELDPGDVTKIARHFSPIFRLESILFT